MLKSRLKRLFGFPHREQYTNNPNKDIEHVTRGLERATKGGLPVEFILWFGYEMQNTDDVGKAVAAAIYEWDL